MHFPLDKFKGDLTAYTEIRAVVERLAEHRMQTLGIDPTANEKNHTRFMFEVANAIKTIRDTEGDLGPNIYTLGWWSRNGRDIARIQYVRTSDIHELERMITFPVLVALSGR